MATSAKKNAKAKQETTSTSNIKKLIGLIDQLEEHIIKRHKFPYGLIYAELSGDFPLGDSRQPIYKSLRPFDLVS
ncbi:hypothetical protein NQ772_18610 [Acinetobacter baumannii]|nr:hypothetical protein [Acinetobacter baumannii]